jgi:hypothetical protein
VVSLTPRSARLAARANNIEKVCLGKWPVWSSDLASGKEQAAYPEDGLPGRETGCSSELKRGIKGVGDVEPYEG